MELSQSVADNDPDPLTKIFAYIHDVSKVEGTTVHLGLHEAGSASLAKNIVRSTFDTPVVRNNLMKSLGLNNRAEYDQYIEQVGRCGEVAVSSHGYKEFPYNKSQESPINPALGLYKLFGQLYVDGSVKPDKYAANCSSENKRFLERVIEGVREADMFSGITLAAMSKYHTMASEAGFYNHPPQEGGHPRHSSLDYQMSLAETYYTYLGGDMPDVLGIADARSAEIQQTALIFALAARATGQYESSDNNITRLNHIFVGHLGDTQYNALMEQSLRLKQLFEAGQDPTQKDDKNKNFMQHVDEFSKLASIIGQIYTEPITDPEFSQEYRKFITQTLPDLKKSFNSPTQQ